ncbi:putative ATP-grasp-modified RiPP [Streptomyces sp. NPDC012461]|uniref:putative ATP-grasp-modified RiPP n=1 Tax=unclassified Streptomyces TaxID=2593676 RepID=UPI0013DA88B6|nr:putative ATP-grasp-modified RiPP [Streptomyces sp. SID9913]
MFHHMDRFPTGSPLPQGHLTAVPWGLRRIAPYPPAGTPAYQAVGLDSATQTARYLDATGSPAMSPGHGTSSGTNPSTGTTGQGDRNSDSPDSDTGNDTDQ